MPKTKAAAAAATIGKRLLPVSSQDLPNWDSNFHPMTVGFGEQADIRQLFLSIKSLLAAAVYLPYTDFSGDNKTAFNFPVLNALGGMNGQVISGLVPGELNSIMS